MPSFAPRREKPESIVEFDQNITNSRRFKRIKGYLLCFFNC